RRHPLPLGREHGGGDNRGGEAGHFRAISARGRRSPVAERASASDKGRGSARPGGRTHARAPGRSGCGIAQRRECSAADGRGGTRDVTRERRGYDREHRGTARLRDAAERELENGGGTL